MDGNLRLLRLQWAAAAAPATTAEQQQQQQHVGEQRLQQQQPQQQHQSEDDTAAKSPCELSARAVNWLLEKMAVEWGELGGLLNGVPRDWCGVVSRGRQRAVLCRVVSRGRQRAEVEWGELCGVVSRGRQ